MSPGVFWPIPRGQGDERETEKEQSEKTKANWALFPCSGA